jgi:acetyltransferase-like isoleucine patch superfamily enzyme
MRLGRPWSSFTRFHGQLKLAMFRRMWSAENGSGTILHPSALLDRTWPRGLHIGKDCIIAAHAAVLTHDFTRGLLTDTSIGARCVIGERAIIMPGLRIGDDCIIRPGAVVTRDMPHNSQACGNPATITPRQTKGSSTNATAQG